MKHYLKVLFKSRGLYKSGELNMKCNECLEKKEKNDTAGAHFPNSKQSTAPITHRVNKPFLIFFLKDKRRFLLTRNLSYKF